MSFFTSTTGRVVDGSDAKAFSNAFPSLPDGLCAPACIKKFTQEEYEDEIYYQVIWSILEGEFKGCSVKQRITVYDANPDKAERALNMMYRIFKLCDHKTDYVDAPDSVDLLPMTNKMCDIKIGNGVIEGVDRTWVREVHELGKLGCVTPHVRTEVKSNKEGERELSALERNKPKREESPFL